MIKMGVIGYGFRIDHFCKNSLKKIYPSYKIAGIVDKNPQYCLSFMDEKEKQEAVFYKDIQELVLKAKPDAIMIGTRCNTHTHIAIEASAYNLPVFLEKPVAVNMEQAIKLEKAFEKSKCPVIVSFPLRFTTPCLIMKEQIDKKTIGSPEHILAVNYVPYGTVYWEQGYQNYNITQGLFLQKATHDFDYMMFILGKNIKSICATATIGHIFGGNKSSGLYCSKCSEAEDCLESPLNREMNGSGNCQPDHACVFSKDCGTPKTGMNEESSSAIFEFEDGTHGVYTQVFIARRDAAARGAAISGYNGTVSFDFYKNKVKIVNHHKPYTDTIKIDGNGEHFGGDIALAHNFIDVIKGKTKSLSPTEAGIQSVYACLAAKESLNTKKFTKVRQVGQL